MARGRAPHARASATRVWAHLFQTRGLCGHGWRGTCGALTRSGDAPQPNRAVCDPGREDSGNGYDCINCHPGFYGPGARTPMYRAKCAKCPEGTTTQTWGSDRASNCSVCDLGWGAYKATNGAYKATFQCEKCKAGYYAPGGDTAANSTGCRPCPTCYTSLPGSAACTGEHGPAGYRGRSGGAPGSSRAGAGGARRRPASVA